ncbi:RFA2 [Auxenochlorella protothecoides x Auxenochlorella symbiontica]
MTTFYGAGNGGFDASASQFAGGGFMPSQGATAGGSAQKRSTYDSKNQTLRAFTIKQLYDAASATADDQLSVDGRDVTNVTLVGKITAVEEQNLVSIYTLDDGTGTMLTKYWIPEQDDALERQHRAEWRVGVYVRAHGHVNHFNREKMLVAFNIRLITDHNEVTYHGLQTIFQHLHLTRGLPAADAAAPAGAAVGYGAAAGPLPGATAVAGLTPVLNDVLGLFHAVGGQNENGASISDVVARSGGRYTVQQIQDAVEALQNDGQLYSTKDDQHYKPCNAL